MRARSTGISCRSIMVSTVVLFFIAHSLLPWPDLFGGADQMPQHPLAKLRKERMAAGLLIIDESGAQSTPDIAQGRNLDKYRRLGPLDGGRNYAMSDEECEQNSRALLQAREFLWNNWKAPARAYLILTRRTVDAISTSHIFIEPDDPGRWRLVCRIVRQNGEVNDWAPVYSVDKKVRTNAADDRNRYPFGAKEILVLRSGSGKLIGEF